jgi:polar amino acid transport system permease protein
MTTTADTAAPVPPDPIRAVPVRHPGRWVTIAVLAVLVAMFVNMLVTNEAFQWRFMFDNMFNPPVLTGARTAIVMTVLSMVFGVALGIVIAVMRLSSNPIIRTTAWIYTWFFRSVPRLVLLFLFGNLGVLYKQVGLGVPFDRQLLPLLGLHGDTTVLTLDARTFLSAFMAGLLGLTFSEAAYMAEIVRAGIQSIDPGQAEAAQALGMRPTLTMRRIILPQAMRVIVPPTGNETIAMLKDTALLAFIPVTDELFFQLQGIGNRTFQIFPMAVAACLWYGAMTSVLMAGQYFLERHFARGVQGRAKEQLYIAGVVRGSVLE